MFLKKNTETAQLFHWIILIFDKNSIFSIAHRIVTSQLIGSWFAHDFR